MSILCAIKDLFEENNFVRSEVNTGEVLKNFEANSEKSLPFFNFVCEMVGECGTPEVRRQTKGKSAACHVHCPGGWSHPKDTMVTMKMQTKPKSYPIVLPYPPKRYRGDDEDADQT